MDFDYATGTTPLDPNEIEGLLLTHITTRQQLDRWEQDNINEALAWLEKRKPKEILSESFLKKLHQRMFGNVWGWAGRFRQSDKNIGISWYQIPVQLRLLNDDVEYWIKHQTFSPDEIAVRFHHLVSIHLFPNGNGRHARLAADLLLDKLRCAKFSWGKANLAAAGTDRKRYINSLLAADKGDYSLLLEFVRS